MKYTRENIIEGIKAKLDEMFGENSTTEPMSVMFKNVLPQYPIEIEQNVLEWINNEPITEVDCHGISIKHIMDRKNLSEFHMPQLIKNFIDFKNNGFVGDIVCYKWL